MKHTYKVHMGGLLAFIRTTDLSSPLDLVLVLGADLGLCWGWGGGSMSYEGLCWEEERQSESRQMGLFLSKGPRGQEGSSLFCGFVPLYPGLSPGQTNDLHTAAFA